MLRVSNVGFDGGTTMATKERFDVRVFADTWAGQAADAWLSLANRYAMGGYYPSLYLYIRSDADRSPAWVRDDETADVTWTLADASRYPASNTRDQTAARIRSIVGRLPIIPERFR